MLSAGDVRADAARPAVLHLFGLTSQHELKQEQNNSVECSCKQKVLCMRAKVPCGVGKNTNTTK